MKRTITIISLTIILGCFPLVTGDAALHSPRANLILNPSFDGNIDHWDSGPADSFVYDSSQSFDVIGGSGKLDAIDTGPYHLAVMFQDHSFTPATYYIKARVMVNTSLGSSGYIALVIGEIEIQEITNPTPNEWHTLNGSVESTGSDVAPIIVGAEGYAGDFLLWVDLVEMDTSPITPEFDTAVILLVCTTLFIRILYFIQKKKSRIQ